MIYRILKYLFCIFVLTFSGSHLQAGKWQDATLIYKSGETICGQVKAGRNNFSTFLKFKVSGSEVIQTVKPDEVQAVTTVQDTFVSLKFTEDIIGYNLSCFARSLSLGCINLYEVNYPYKSCACHTAGSYHFDMVMKMKDRPLVIIEDAFLTGKIKNPYVLCDYLKSIPKLAERCIQYVKTRDELIDEIMVYNAHCTSNSGTFWY